MTPREAHPKFVADVCVAPFAMRDDELAVITVQGEQGSLSLPSAPVLAEHAAVEGRAPLDNLALDTMRAALPDTLSEPTLEPLVWQTKSAVPGGRVKIGYAAAAHLIEVPSDSNLYPIKLSDFADKSSRIQPSDQTIVRNGLASLQDRQGLSWPSFLAGKNTLQILSRLLYDPSQFTVTELRLTCQALMFASLDPKSSPPKLDRPNFNRIAKSLPIAPTGELENSGGRPAQLWTMPSYILDPER